MCVKVPDEHGKFNVWCPVSAKELSISQRPEMVNWLSDDLEIPPTGWVSTGAVGATLSNDHDRFVAGDDKPVSESY